MDVIGHLALGFSVALTPINLLHALVGVLVGTLIGVLPGIGPVATIAMLLPTTYGLQPVSALIMLAGIDYGAQYGGSTTSILINMPGETSSAYICPDDHPMALKGEAGAALAVAAMGSFFAGCVATVMIAAFSPLRCRRVALKFGPAEYCSLMVLGLIGAVVLAHGTLLKAIAMVVLGLLLGIVVTDVNSGMARFAFDIPELIDGIGVVRGGDGPVRLRRDRQQSRKYRKRAIVAAKVKGLWLTPQAVAPGGACRAAGHRAGIGAGTPARWGRDARLVRRLHRRKESRQGPQPLRQGSDRGRRRSRVGQQRRCADLVHPVADPRNPGERRDGPDGRRDDHPQHPARACR